MYLINNCVQESHTQTSTINFSNAQKRNYLNFQFDNKKYLFWPKKNHTHAIEYQDIYNYYLIFKSFIHLIYNIYNHTQNHTHTIIFNYSFNTTKINPLGIK